MHVTCEINNFTGNLYAFVGNLNMPESAKIYNIYIINIEDMQNRGSLRYVANKAIFYLSSIPLITFTKK